MVLLTHHLKDLKLVFFHRGMDLSRVSSTYSPFLVGWVAWSCLILEKDLYL